MPRGLALFPDELPFNASCQIAGEPAKRWHMTMLRQRRAACRWHPCCPYGAPSLHNLSDWLSASLGEVKAGSESPLQQPGHPFRRQQCYRFSDIADATAWPYLSGCMREASWRSSLVLMGTSCGRGGGRRYNAEQAAPGSGGKKAAPFLSENVGEWPFPLMRGRLFASSDRSCNQGSERGSGNQDLCKTEERSVCACRCCQQGKHWHFPRRAAYPASLR